MQRPTTFQKEKSKQKIKNVSGQKKKNPQIFPY